MTLEWSLPCRRKRRIGGYDKAMPDPIPTPPSPKPAPPSVPKGPTINIAEEFGTAKRNLPPAKIVLIAVAAVLVVVAITSYLTRAKPQAAGSLDLVTAVQIPDQTSTMAALTFTLNNSSDKMLYVHTLQGKIKTASGEFTANAVSAVDFDRYFQIFPTLKAGSQPALSPESKIQSGEIAARTIVVVFPVKLDVFNQRQTTSVIIQPYETTVPVVLTK